MPSYLETGFADRVDGFSGYLHINMVDLRLPGPAGMEIVVQRYYSSNVWNRVDNWTLLSRHTPSADPGDHLGGSGWQLHMGKIVNPNPTGGPTDHPTLIMPDGSTHPLFNRINHPGERITTEGWLYKRSGKTHIVTRTDGMAFLFDETAIGSHYLLHDAQGTSAVQCTRIEDPNGNAIDIQYGWVEAFAPYYLSTIERISFDDADDHRWVQFVYETGSNRLKELRIKDGSATLQSWAYQYGPVQASVLQLNGRSREVYPLTVLRPPEGSSWRFSYYSAAKVPGDGRYLLEGVTLPSGGRITYDYEPETFDTGSQTCSDGYFPKFAAVRSRAVTDRDGSNVGSWEYSYLAGGDEGAQTLVTIRDRDGRIARTEDLTFHGWESWVFFDDLMWRVGLIKNRRVVVKAPDSGDLDILTETTSWMQGASISGDSLESSLWTSCASSRQMTGISFVKPVTTERIVRRSSGSATAEYRTLTSEIDDWGNPGLIEESSDDGLSRTTEIRYWQEPDLNIMVGRVEARDADPGGVECFKYDALGRLSKHFVNPRTDDVSACNATTPSYARETRFAYDSSGNLSEEVRENGSNDVRTTYTDYAYGQRQRTFVENGADDVLICREIEPLGTVGWETDGRGTSCLDPTYRTTYEYDKLGRMTRSTPPLGTSTTYTYSADWSEAEITRGPYELTYSFNGLGWLEREHDVTKDHLAELEHDPLGILREQRVTLGGRLADASSFDPLGRLTSVEHPDGSGVTYEYEGSTVRTTDEEGRTTRFDYAAFGDPEDRRLVRLVDAEGKTTSYGYDDVFGLLDFVDAPITRADRSFTYFEGASNYSNGLLATERHPESGTTEYQYDRLGNVTRRTRGAAGEVTEYGYDRVGRLLKIDPAGADFDVTFAYNGAGLRTGMSSSQGAFTAEYDANQRMTRRSSVIGGKGYASQFHYDDLDRLWKVAYPSGRGVSYTFDNKGRLAGVHDANGGSDYVSGVTYNSWGSAEAVTYQGGAATVYDYDNRFRIRSIRTAKGAQKHLDLSFTYDDVSNLVTWTDLRDASRNRSFTYDRLDRLRSSSAPGLWGEESFTYNALGDRLTATLDGVTSSYSYNSTTGHLASVSGTSGGAYSFDALGRLTSSPTVVEVADLTVGDPTPAASAVTEGGSAAFSVAPAGGSAPYAYQWQFSAVGPGSGFSNCANGGGLSGVTSSQLSITSATLARTGWYRCRVKDSSVPIQTVLSSAVRLTVEQAGGGSIGEIGSVLVNQNLTRVAFSRSFTNPVVIAQPPSFSGGDAAVVRVTEVGPDGFSLFVHEAPNLDGSHTQETVHWVVLEAGSWVLESGVRVEAGTIESSATVGRGIANEWAQVALANPFEATPVVLTQVQTNRDPWWVKTRQQGASTAAFQVAMEHEDAVTPRHGLETLGWVAIEPSAGIWSGHPYHAGSTPDAVTHGWYTVPFAQQLGSVPHLIASIATFDGADASQLRQQNLGPTSAQIKVEEDTTYDAEVNHTTEIVSFLAVGGSGLLSGEEYNPGTQPLRVSAPSPPSLTLDEGGTGSMAVSASGGSGSYQYRWQFSSTNPTSGFTVLSNGGGYTGVTTRVITINPAAESHAGFYRCRVTDGAETVFSSSTELVVNRPQQDVMVAADSFAGLTPGAPINGRSTEIGGRTWYASTSAVAGNAANATGLTGQNPLATLDFEPSDHQNGVVAIEADLGAKDSNWVAIGMAENKLAGWWADGQVWVLLKPNGTYNVLADGTETSLIGGAQTIPAAFDPNGSNRVKLVYDPVARTAEVWINGTKVMGPAVVPNGSDGVPPAIHYAGWSAMAATQNSTAVDNFSLRVIAASGKVMTRTDDGVGFSIDASVVGPADRSQHSADPSALPIGELTGGSARVATVESQPKGTLAASISYTWTPLDALASATTPEGTELYTYDGDGLRISKSHGGEGVHYVRDGGGQILAEYDEDGRLLAEYVYAMGRRIAKVSPSGLRFYYHTDLVGTPLVITDQGGNLSWRGEYLPFGSEYTSTDAGDHFKFTGKELEDHTGLYYFEARYYDPATGRFVSVDPVGGDPASSQSWNRYAYVENNPVRRTDPTGETFWDVLDIGFFAASIGNLWVKAIEGTPITAADNLQVAGDAVGMMPIVPAIGSVGRVTKEGLEHGAALLKGADDLADGAQAATSRGRTVLGHHPGYIEKAAELGARRFNIPEKVWRGMTDAERWNANQKFLDRLIKRGDEVILSTPANQARRGSFFERELKYLQNQGYKLVDDGTRLVPNS